MLLVVRLFSTSVGHGRQVEARVLGWDFCTSLVHHLAIYSDTFFADSQTLNSERQTHLTH